VQPLGAMGEGGRSGNAKKGADHHWHEEDL